MIKQVQAEAISHSPQRSLNVGILVERRYLQQAQPSGLVQALQRRGHQVTLIDPQDALYRMGDNNRLAGLDLAVARGRSAGVFGLLAWMEQQGVPTYNRHAAITAVYNKAYMSLALTHADVPTPPTFFGPPEQLSQVPDDCFPLILKPIFGDNGCGLRLIENRRLLSQITWSEPFLVAQRYLENDGYDIKLYGIGDQVWAVQKPSPLHPAAAAPRLLPLTPQMRQIATACRRLFGLDFFGVDCIETDGRLFVIEVNEFPTYSAVPHASEHLADWLELRTAPSVDETVKGLEGKR